MGSYYVLKLLDDRGVYFPYTYLVGNVEIRSPKADYKCELDCIVESVASSERKPNLDFTCRLGTIVTAGSIQEAVALADENFIKALDLIYNEYPTSKVGVMNCGYVKDLDTGELTHIAQHTFFPSLSFRVRNSTFPAIEFSQWLAKQDSELAVRYTRSLHWGRNARWEPNLQVRILFYWFAVEALFKESESDNVAPIVRWFLGYPNGKQARNVDPDLLRKLKANKRYDLWKKPIEDGVEDIRVFRNNSIHSGFRNVEFPSATIKFYNSVMNYGATRCQGAVVSALTSGIRTVQEFKEYLWVIFESNQNLINDVHNNILYSFESKTFDLLNERII